MKRTQITLRTPDGTISCAFAHPQIAVALAAPDGRLLQVNQAYCDITGYPAEELRGVHFHRITHPDDVDGELRALESLVAGELSDCIIKKRYITKGGEVIWAQLSVAVERDAAGTPLRLVALVQDVTGREHAQQALRESERRFRAIFDGALDAMLLADDTGRYVAANPAACELLGRTAEELAGSFVSDVTSAELSTGDAWQAFRTAGRASGEWRLTRPDGTVRAVEFAATANVLPGLHLSVLRDITRRKAVEAELRSKTEVLQTIFDNIPVMISFLDAAGRIDWVNRHWQHVLGWSLPEVRGRHVLSEAYPDPREREEVLRLVREAPPGWHERRPMTKHGKRIDTSWAGVRLSDGRVINIGQEISERKRSERERERRAEQLQALADAAIAISAATSIREIAEVVAARARQIIGAHAAVSSLTLGEGWGQAIAGSSFSAKYASSRDQAAEPDRSGIYRLVCATNRPLRLTQEELEGHPAWRGSGSEAGRNPPLRGLLCIPCVGREGVNLGLIRLTDRYEGEFTAEDEAILGQLARLTSQALENTRLLNEVSAARARLEALSKRLVSLQEEERGSIARELHDEVGQLLTGLSLMIADDSAADAGRRREEITRIVHELIQRVRDLSMNLRPPMLDELGLLPTLLWQIERFEKQTGIKVEFRCASLERRFSPQTELTAFRIIQEALTNVARHARASRVRITVCAQDGILKARIEDEGEGFDVKSVLSRRSSGLVGMGERSRLLGGRLTIRSRPGEGTRISVRLPLAARSAGEEAS